MQRLFKKAWQNLSVEQKNSIEGLHLKKLGVILKPTDNLFERKAVLNPACWQEGDFVHLFYRAIDDNHDSTVGYAKLKGPTEVIERKNVPFIPRNYGYESRGVEDPRITKIEDTFYMTYVAHDGKDAITAYAEGVDLLNFKKKGIISPLVTYKRAGSLFREEKLKDRYLMFQAYYQNLYAEDVLLWFKDVLLFPRKINGKFAMLIRILPDIQIIFFNNFDELRERGFWKRNLKNIHKNVVLENKYWFESRNIGGGAPPLYTKEGWLIIFHTVEELNRSRVYHASAALLDLKNPFKVIGRLERPLFSPDEEWEKSGYVNNVVFPTGTAVFGDDLYIYYGAADQQIAVAKVKQKDLIRKLKATPEK